MDILRKITVLLAALVLSAGLFACEREGPAERAGEQIDETAEETKEATEDIIDD